MRMAGIVALGALIVVVPRADSAAPAVGCTLIMQQINSAVATINRNAGTYWSYRKSFVELKFGPSSVAPDASMRAGQVQSQALPLQATIPSAWQNLTSLVDTAQTQKCSTAGNLAAIRESSFKLARGVRFDRFPPEENVEADTEKPKRMPSK